MSKVMVYLFFGLTLAVFLSSCTIFNRPPTEPPAAQMLPNLAGYQVVEGQQLTGYISTLSEGAVLLAGQPELAAAIEAVDQVTGCYQEVGAVRARVYSNEAEPLSAGAVAIADRKALLDPLNLFNCVKPSQLLRGFAGGIEPCSASYTLEKDNNAFYIIYVGTTPEICQAFCAALEGCEAHKPQP
jgi:hypothetical protein